MHLPHDRSTLGTASNSRRRRGAAFGLVASALVLLVASQVVMSPRAGAATPGPPPVPASGAYFGAFVAPHETQSVAQADIRQELADIGNFDGNLGRPLGLVHVYQNWQSPVRNAVLAALASTGATPLIDWTCTSDADIIDGSQDDLITSYAEALQAYGRPVFIRWFWEMNLIRLPRVGSCLAGLGSDGYIQAWQRIVTIFRRVGADNVSFVWCPSIVDPSFAAAFYPGDQYVDWIGVDGYDRRQDPNTRTDQFLPFYDHWMPENKPLMIGETGATTDQASYLAELAADLPSTFPGIKAVVYYDSESTLDWTLTDAPGNLGLSQFIAMGQLPYFSFPFMRP